MLNYVNYVGAICDNCMRDLLIYDVWAITDDDKHYCPDCYSYDDDDNIIIDLDRKDKFGKNQRKT